jgi:hypothetical protein
MLTSSAFTCLFYFFISTLAPFLRTSRLGAESRRILLIVSVVLSGGGSVVDSTGRKAQPRTPLFGDRRESLTTAGYRSTGLLDVDPAAEIADPMLRCLLGILYSTPYPRCQP